MRTVLTAMLLAAPIGAAAQTGPVVEHAWARATASAAQAGAVYLVVHDVGADQLTGFSTPVAAAADLHQSRMVNGVMEMRPVASLVVGPGHDITLAPGGYHVMLTGLKHPLKAGDHFPLTLTFARSGPLTTEVAVGSAGASGPKADGAMDGMDMTDQPHR